VRLGGLNKSGRLAAGAALAALSMVAAGCGGSVSSGSVSSGSASSGSASTTASSATPSSSTSSSASTTTSDHAVAPKRSHRNPGKPVGHTQLVHAGTSTLSVTVTRVLDPVSGSGAAKPPGTRAVGVQLVIHNDGGATYDSTASGDVSVVPSTGMAAPLFFNAGVCQTPLTDFESLIGVGETRSGCVGFAVPRGARILAVRFSPHSRLPGSVTWR
jgi:hypothetical protein